MAIFSVNPNLFNTVTIAAQQANAGTDPWLVVSDYAAWIDNNQPLDFAIANGGAWIIIPDWNTMAILDYIDKWPMPA